MTNEENKAIQTAWHYASGEAEKQSEIARLNRIEKQEDLAFLLEAHKLAKALKSFAKWRKS